MKKVMRNHQEWKRDKLRFFHLRKDIQTMAKASYQKNKCKVSKNNRESIPKVKTSTQSLERLTTEVLLSFQTIISQSFKKNNSSHLLAGLGRGLFTKANNSSYRKMKIKPKENKTPNKAEAGLTLPSISKFIFKMIYPICIGTEKTLVEVGLLLRVPEEEQKIKL